MTNRDKRLNISLMTNILVKFITIFSNLLLVPLLYNYLGRDKYGIWLTLYSLVNWLTMFDLGIGNGLRIKLTEAFSLRKIHQIKTLISTTYIFITVFVTFLIMSLLISNLFIRWEIILGLTNKTSLEIRITFNILIISFLSILLLKNISIIYASLQLNFIDSLISSLNGVLFLITIYILQSIKNQPNLIIIGISAVIFLLIILIFLNSYFFLKKAPSLKISLNSFSFDAFKQISKPGIIFFVIQVSGLFLYSSSNLLITNLISAEAVSDYNIAFQYFNLPFIVFSLFISTHWHSFIDALYKEDIKWIKQKIYKFKLLFFLLIISYVFLFLLFDTIVPFWLNSSNYHINNNLKISLIIFFLVSSYATIYVYVINASGKLIVQLITYICIALTNIPLGILFVKNLKFGVEGIVFANTICLLSLTLILPYQYNKIIKNKCYGIWNK